MAYTVIGHRTRERCPRCRKSCFCDDCGICSACGFSPPAVDLVQPPAPAPAIGCAECGGTVLHGRKCSVTLTAVAN